MSFKSALPTLLLFLTLNFAQAQKHSPIPVIFDTDIAGDYDDVGAMALLHAFADKGEAKILATISCNAFETTAPTISVINTYFGRPEIPIGIVKKDKPNKDCSQRWAQAIIAGYPHKIKSNSQAVEAVALYRKILASQADASVTIISVGFFTNLAGLLHSGADKYSRLTGEQLVKQKVKNLVSMATGIGADGKTFSEYNVNVDAASAQEVFKNWPTPITLSGFEIGEKILTGIKLTNNYSIQNSPIKDAFQIALEKDKNTVGRNSWDETAVLTAIRGAKPYFTYRKLNMEIKDDGTDVVIPGEKFLYLQFAMKPDAIAKDIEQLMMHQPIKKAMK
ncbi:Inosine-uridine nucleoside N-ribohydrolase [Mucilaginibacter gossypiicola]|uniref:Inosine-uridine nucleoside N-ribohydrolase n=1 Tax=Mucilaginibacter gossypiicola TaxID=551995 RepID=A0A1H8LGK5_9SPHI|nr:nucleoside hydrolase [Mucilaginibacter gossypiicola]SEO04284.1 Inosine-uridine nucleoside N-ribohydrolase [Mucilaginibacter gossypiicola]